MAKAEKNKKLKTNQIMVVINSLCETFVGVVILWMALGPYNAEGISLLESAQTHFWEILFCLIPILLIIIFLINLGLYLIKLKK